MANILFKRGTYAQFKDLTSFIDGALYFVEDAGQLYLGTSTGKTRIQGTVVQYTDFTSFSEGVQPPYDSDVIYYIAASNALIRYDGSKWIQLNVTKDTFDALVVRVGNVEGVASQNAKDIESLKALVGDGVETGNIVDLISGLDGRVEALETWKTNTVTPAISDLTTRLGTAEGTITNHGTRLTDVEADVETAQGRADDAYALADAAVTSGELNTALSPYAKSADVDTAFTNLKGGSTKTLAQLDTDITNVNTTATNAAAAAKTADDKAVAADGKAVAAQKTVDDYIDAHKNDYTNSTLDSKIADAKQAGTDAAQAAQNAANAASTADGKAVEAKNRADEAYNLANGKIDLAGVQALNYATKSEAEGYAKAVQGSTDKTVKDAMDAAGAADVKAGNAGTAAKNAQDAIDAYIENHKNDYTNKQIDDTIDEAIKSNDAMTFRGVINSTDDLTAAAQDAQRGDTYKIGTVGKYANFDCRVGDLLINNADDGETPSWVHISSGDEEREDQVLRRTGKTIELLDELGSKVVGKIGFNSNNFEITGDSPTTIEVALVWDGFVETAN